MAPALPTCHPARRPSRIRPGDVQPTIAKRSVRVFLIAIGLVSCASPTLLSGGDLPPEEQSQLRARRGIKVLQIDEKSVNGRWLILKPGTYEIEFFSAQDAKSVNSALGGVVEELTCKVDVELLPGEAVSISSEMRRGGSRFSGGYSMFNFHTEVSIDSSIEGRSNDVDTSRCEGRMNCRKVDRTQVMPVGCH